EEAASHQATISGLAGDFREQLGESAYLHFTNLTPWHESLPKGVTEHPYVTAAGLCALENRGVQAGEVDIIYSQAAAYFEQDYTAFLRSAARLLKGDGVLIFNHDPVLASAMDEVAWEHGLRLVRRKQMGGMNGAIARYHRLRSSPMSQMVFPGVNREQDEEVVCESLVMSALRRSVEV
ncbi:TPA: class I SAM-dependent methyltransferase, partial [Klebsiella pneumoniae]|nr:class I SAM-dependent methyltransferase [Klebsiella pneumoniae]